jgi:hypothetical protein
MVICFANRKFRLFKNRLLKINFKSVDRLETIFFLYYVVIKGEDILTMEDVRVVKKVTDCNPNGLRTKERPKSRWIDEVINHLKKTNLRNSKQIFKDINACNDLVQRTKSRVRFVGSEEEEDYTVIDNFVVRE